MKKPITITLNEGLIDEIDEKRGLIPRSRFVELLVLRILSEEKKEEVVMGYA